MKKNEVNETNSVNPYKEMDDVKKELEETLPFDKIDESQEQEEPERTEVKKDYLDDYSQTQNNQKSLNQPLMFNDDGGKDNLIINLLKVDWERIEHIVRGHKPMIDNKGNEYFVQMTEHYLNDYGVNSILHFLSFYLSKDIKLGRYTIEQVKKRMEQFSTQFTNFFYDNLNEFGLNNPSKKKMSNMFVRAVIDLVDASYSCAIEGRTIELMLKQFQVLQQQPIDDNNPYQNQGNQPKKQNMMQRIFS